MADGRRARGPRPPNVNLGLDRGCHSSPLCVSYNEENVKNGPKPTAPRRLAGLATSTGDIGGLRVYPNARRQRPEGHDNVALTSQRETARRLARVPIRSAASGILRRLKSSPVRPA